MTPWPPRTTPTSSGCARDEIAQAEAEIEARPLPVEPAEPAAEGVGDSVPPFRGGREGDQRVGVEMVDVGGGEKSVQRRVDRRHRAARPEAGVVEQGDHLVLLVEALVDALHRAQPLEVDQGEPVDGQGAEVAAGPFHREHAAGLPGDRVGELDLGRGVAAAEVRDARIRPEAARPLDERDDLRVLERTTRHTRWSCRGCRRLRTCRAASAGGRSGRRTRPCRRTGRRAAARRPTTARDP